MSVLSRLSFALIFTVILSLFATEKIHAQQRQLINVQADQLNAESVLQESEVVKVKAQWSANGIKPGQPMTLALIFDLAENGHMNSNDPGDPDLIALKTELTSQENSLKIAHPVFPESKVYSIPLGQDSLDINSYEKQAVVLIPVELNGTLKPGEYSLKLLVDYQACDGPECLAPEFLSIDLPIEVLAEDQTQIALVSPWFNNLNFMDLVKQGSKQNAVGSVESSDFDFFGMKFSVGSGPLSIALILILGFIAGALLNVMPCVLPVLPLKVMSLRKHAENPGKAFMLGLIFSLGIIFCFALLGVLAAGLVSGSNQLQWGQQFSNWWFTAGLGAIMFVMGLGMMGLFTMQLPQKVYFLQPSADSYGGSFAFGILTAVLSTPCTGPLFAGTLAWALKQPAWLSLSAFVLMGIGMALPYQLLTLKPSWLDKLPKSGPSGVIIKYGMGISLIAVAVYFFGVAGQSFWSDWYWFAIAATLIGGFIYLSIYALKTSESRKLQIGMWAATLALCPVLIYSAFQLRSGHLIQWQQYEQFALDKARANDQIAVVEFTAQWCANCKVLESTVFSDEEVADRLNASDVAALKVDLTSSSNTLGWEKLKELGGKGIPLTAVYLPGQEEPVLLSSIYRRQDLLKLLDRQQSNEPASLSLKRRGDLTQITNSISKALITRDLESY